MNNEEYEKIKAQKLFEYKHKNLHNLLNQMWGAGWQEILQEAFKRSGLESFWDDPDRVIQQAVEIVGEQAGVTA